LGAKPAFEAALSKGAGVKDADIFAPSELEIPSLNSNENR
jgi:hypothetical protein